VRALIISILVALGAGCGGHRTHVVEHRAWSPACPVRIDTTPIDGTVFPTWLAAWTALTATADSTMTEEQAQSLLCTGNGCNGDGPSILRVGDHYHLAVPVPEGLLVFTDVGVGETRPCLFAPYLEIVAGAPLRVEMTDIIIDYDPRTEACVSADAGYTDVFFDLATRRRILSVDRDHIKKNPFMARPGITDWRDPVAITVVPGGVRVSGAGCDQTIPFPR